MPIYAYKCDSCGFAKDVLQKIADDPLSDCPSCGQTAFQKQLTAAGFQLKGTGWYVTDFRGGKAEPSGDKAATDTPPAASSGADAASSATPAIAATPTPVAAAAPSTPATSSAAPAAST
jgi:putative FmdB family regulatory protein